MLLPEMRSRCVCITIDPKSAAALGFTAQASLSSAAQAKNQSQDHSCVQGRISALLAGKMPAVGGSYSANHSTKCVFEPDGSSMLAGSAHLINLHGTCWKLLQERTLDQQHEQHQERLAGVIGRGYSWRQAQQKGLGAACKHLVGRRVAVWWPNDKKYYEGIITDFYHSNSCTTKHGIWASIMGRHRVEYDDGEVELLDMTRETWRLTEAELKDLARTAGQQAQPPQQSAHILGKQKHDWPCEDPSVPDPSLAAAAAAAAAAAPAGHAATGTNRAAADRCHDDLPAPGQSLICLAPQRPREAVADAVISDDGHDADAGSGDGTNVTAATTNAAAGVRRVPKGRGSGHNGKAAKVADADSDSMDVDRMTDQDVHTSPAAAAQQHGLLVAAARRGSRYIRSCKQEASGEVTTLQPASRKRGRANNPPNGRKEAEEDSEGPWTAPPRPANDATAGSIPASGGATAVASHLADTHLGNASSHRHSSTSHELLAPAASTGNVETGLLQVAANTAGPAETIAAQAADTEAVTAGTFIEARTTRPLSTQSATSLPSATPIKPEEASSAAAAYQLTPAGPAKNSPDHTATQYDTLDHASSAVAGSSHGMMAPWGLLGLQNLQLLAAQRNPSSSSTSSGVTAAAGVASVQAATAGAVAAAFVAQKASFLSTHAAADAQSTDLSAVKDTARQYPAAAAVPPVELLRGTGGLTASATARQSLLLAVLPTGQPVALAPVPLFNSFAQTTSPASATTCAQPTLASVPTVLAAQGNAAASGGNGSGASAAWCTSGDGRSAVGQLSSRTTTQVLPASAGRPPIPAAIKPSSRYSSSTPLCRQNTDQDLHSIMPGSMCQLDGTTTAAALAAQTQSKVDDCLNEQATQQAQPVMAAVGWRSIPVLQSVASSINGVSPGSSHHSSSSSHSGSRVQTVVGGAGGSSSTLASQLLSQLQQYAAYAAGEHNNTRCMQGTSSSDEPAAAPATITNIRGSSSSSGTGRCCFSSVTLQPVVLTGTLKFFVYMPQAVHTSSRDSKPWNNQPSLQESEAVALTNKHFSGAAGDGNDPRGEGLCEDSRPAATSHTLPHTAAKSHGGLHAQDRQQQQGTEGSPLAVLLMKLPATPALDPDSVIVSITGQHADARQLGASSSSSSSMALKVEYKAPTSNQSPAPAASQQQKQQRQLHSRLLSGEVTPDAQPQQVHGSTAQHRHHHLHSQMFFLPHPLTWDMYRSPHITRPPQPAAGVEMSSAATAAAASLAQVVTGTLATDSSTREETDDGNHHAAAAGVADLPEHDDTAVIALLQLAEQSGENSLLMVLGRCNAVR